MDSFWCWLQGYCWTGKVSNHHHSVLQRCHGTYSCFISSFFLSHVLSIPNPLSLRSIHFSNKQKIVGGWGNSSVGSVGPQARHNTKMGSMDQKPDAIPKWVQWTKSQTQYQNGFSGPKARCNTKMGSVDQKPVAIPKWVQWTKSQMQYHEKPDAIPKWVRWTKSQMQYQNGFSGPKWVQWTKSQMQYQNGFSGPKARCNTKMGSVDQKPDAIPKWVQWTKTRGNTKMGLIPRCGKGFFLQSAVSVNSLVVFIQPPCAGAGIHICVHTKNLKHWQPYHCVDSQRYCIYCSAGNGKHCSCICL